MEKKKIGIMGGTFNPIHYGHLILAESAYNAANLDSVWFMPSKNPPHKLQDEVIPDIFRKEMVELAISGNPHFEISLLELCREGFTYTVDTLRELNRIYPEIDFYFIIGGDSLFQLDTWKSPGEILKSAHILAASRYHIADEEILSRIQSLNRNYNSDIKALSVPTIDISSKMLRQYLKEGRSVRYYLPEPVRQYIKEQHLYL